MLFFSKLGNDVINLEHVSLIKYFTNDVVTGKLACAIVSFSNRNEMKLTEEGYRQLVDDIDTACSLVKLQQEKGEER